MRSPALARRLHGGAVRNRRHDARRPSRRSPISCFRPNVLRVSRVDPSTGLVGLFDGLASFRWQDGRWIDEGNVEGVTEQIRSLFENADGSLWTGHQQRRCHAGHLRVTARSRSAASCRDAASGSATAEGLPPGGASRRRTGRRTVLRRAATRKPYIVRFDPASSTFSHVTPPSTSSASIAVGERLRDCRRTGRPGLSRMWGRETVVLHEGSGRHVGGGPEDVRPLRRECAAEFPLPRKTGGVVWMVIDGGRLVRFDTTHGRRGRRKVYRR